MHPSHFARSTPDKPAYVMAGSGEVVTYRQLEERSNQGAHLFRSLGLSPQDGVAILLENNPRYFEITWAAQRSGLYYTGISTKLTAEEAAYIVKDSGAKVLITSSFMGAVADQLAALLPGIRLFMVGNARGRYASYESAVAGFPATPIADETAGTDMLYSSGTTGKPKGITPDFPDAPIDAPTALSTTLKNQFKLSSNTIYLSPAPLYHSSPMRWCMTVNRLGGTVILMEKFDAEQTLALIEKYKVTCSQLVPTHFIRLLKLPEAVRVRYDHSSLEVVVHAGSPCPISVKESMLEWWGPIIHEFYAGTELNGMCYISPADWLSHKGSVGRAVLGTVHICADDGEPLPTGEEGLIYFENGPRFSYHHDPEKTKEAYNRYGWSSLGDVGRIDSDGFLFLTDRKSFMIISGGVNIYPLEIENYLISHPAVADVAVIGAPDEEMGEKVVAVVQLEAGTEPSAELAAALIAFARAGLSHVKIPRQVDFMRQLPRHDTGKLYKRLIRDQYWQGRDSKII